MTTFGSLLLFISLVCASSASASTIVEDHGADLSFDWCGSGEVCYYGERTMTEGQQGWAAVDPEWVSLVLPSDQDSISCGCDGAAVAKNPHCASSNTTRLIIPNGRTGHNNMMTEDEEAQQHAADASELRVLKGKKKGVQQQQEDEVIFGKKGKKGDTTDATTTAVVVTEATTTTTTATTTPAGPDPACLKTCCGGTIDAPGTLCTGPATRTTTVPDVASFRYRCYYEFQSCSLYKDCTIWIEEYDFSIPTTCPPREFPCETCCGGTTKNTSPCLAKFSYSSLTSQSRLVRCMFIATSEVSTVLAAGDQFAFGQGCSLPNAPGPVPSRMLLENHEDHHEDHHDHPSSRGEDKNTTVPIIIMKKHKSAAAFLRVPKTGSSTMLKFKSQTPDLYPWQYHLSKPITGSRGLASASACVFAHVPTTAHLGLNYHNDQHLEDDKLIGGRGHRRGGGWWNACPHVPYPILVKQWSQTLEYWAPPEKAVFEDDDDTSNSHSFGLRTFSMVRDPFERLISYFFYLGRFVNSNQFLKHTVTDEQYERVMAGDLFGWMELLHEQGGCGLQLPFQYRYFHEDLETALSLIQEDEHGGAPKIFVMITECYEPSLRLLREHFKDEFESHSVDDFVASPAYKTNKNKNSITNRDSFKKKDLDSQGLRSLRELAQVWFKDDFAFYDAAVKQFQKYMAQSQLDPAHFASCAYWNDGADAELSVAAGAGADME